MLTPVAAGIWIGEGPIVSFHGFAYPTRMVVVRLADGGLWVWSPIALSDPVRGALDALGPVAHLVSPNKLHHLALADWHAAYPAAALWGPRSCLVRHRHIAFTGALDDGPPAAWQAAFEQERFAGSWAMDEMVFFHTASRTVILADLIEALDDGFLHRHWAGWQLPIAGWGGIRAEDPHAPIDWRMTFWRRGEARAARARMLGWGSERVIMAHGVWQASGGQAYLSRAFAWLG